MARPDLVLFIAYPYPPCSEPGATRPSHFVKYLRRLGYNVKVVTAFQANPPRDEVIYVPNRQLVPNRRSIGGVSELVLRKFFFPSDAAMLWAVDAAKACEPILRQHQTTTVFSTFPPINSHIVAWLLKRRHGVRWVADFRDPLVGSPGRELTQSKRRLGAISAAVDRLIQRGAFKDADVLIANTDSVLDSWRRKHPAVSHKLAHIWNGFDPEETLSAVPLPARPFQVIAHVGAIYTGRHPGPLLASMHRLIQNGRLDPKRILVDLVGHVSWNLLPDRELFENLKELGCVRATGDVVGKGEAQQIMREADYLLLLDVIIPGAGQQLPSKIFEYIRIGRPILAITTRNSPTDRVLAGSGIPYSSIYNDSLPDEADQALLDLLARPSDPIEPSKWFMETFDAVSRTRALAKLIDG